MKISALINTHGGDFITRDTLDSVLKFVTEDVLIVVDGKNWDNWGKNLDLGVPKLCGFPHGIPKSPYRNVALGLSSLIEYYPDSDWYVYVENDVLFGSNRFIKNLELADKENIWMLGFDGRIDDSEMPLVESLIGDKFKSLYYLIGCCQFISKNFVKKLEEINFFERFLHITNAFSDGYFPKYNGYDISETMYSTMCRHFGGNIGVFSNYDYSKKEWHGAYEYYPVRWKPQLDSEVDPYKDACIMHPLKEEDDPIRKYHKAKRENGIYSN